MICSRGHKIPDKVIACPTCMVTPPPYPKEWRACSLQQPWASLLAGGKKQYETRSWDAAFRGWFAIHASKQPSNYFDPVILDALVELGFQESAELPLGHIVGIGNLIQTYPTKEMTENLSGRELKFGDFSAGRYAWLVSNTVMLKEPIPCKGALNFWKVPREVAVKLNEQLSTAGQQAVAR